MTLHLNLCPFSFNQIVVLLVIAFLQNWNAPTYNLCLSLNLKGMLETSGDE